MPNSSSGPRPDRAGLAGTIAAAVLMAAAVAPGAAAAAGDEPESQLKEVEAALEQAREHQAELGREAVTLSRQVLALRAQSVVTAKAIQDHEETLSAIEGRLEGLTGRAAETHARLARSRAQIAGTLAALERIARHPPEALLVLPAPPVDVVRGSILLRAAVPYLDGRVRRLTGELAALAGLRARISEEEAELRAAARAMKEKRSRLAALMGRKEELRRGLQADSEEAAKRSEKLAAEAKDLRDLMARLEAAAAATPAVEAGAGQAGAAAAAAARAASGLAPPRPFATARGSITLPARGQMVQRFGQSVDGGLKSRGIAVKARAGAQVVAPYDGEVVFAGPFRGYGHLLIIAHGDGYHILLAGLSRIDSIVGQRVLAGEPVGVLGPSEDGNSQLYFELRHNGEPINPLPWMAAREEKVSG